jgi:anti-sigma factor RsiW
MPNTTTSGHLDPNDVYEFLEGKLSRGRKREVDSHLDRCPDCVETLSMIVRAERPASREEQAELARIPEPGATEVLARLRPSIAASAPRTRSASIDWMPLLAAATILVSLGAASWYVYTRSWLPASSASPWARSTVLSCKPQSARSRAVNSPLVVKIVRRPPRSGRP